jgi:thioredoxin reductase (NADPH)
VLPSQNTIELVQAASAASAGSSTSGEAKSRTQLTAGAFVVAVGGRPSPLQCEGGGLAVSSDDLFGLPSLVSAHNTAAQRVVARGDRKPKVCVVGGGYVALECGGLLAGLGCDVTVLYRSELLRGFDRDCVARVSAGLEAEG